MTTVDLHNVKTILVDAAIDANRLDKVRLEPDGPGGTRRPEIAQTTRSLLALADRLDLAAALVRQEYWAIKGEARVTF